MRVMGPEGEVLENRERGRKPGEQREGKEAWRTEAGKEDWGTRSGEEEEEFTFSNMMSWRPMGSYFG